MNSATFNTSKSKKNWPKHQQFCILQKLRLLRSVFKSFLPCNIVRYDISWQQQSTMVEWYMWVNNLFIQILRIIITFLNNAASPLPIEKMQFKKSFLVKDKIVIMVIITDNTKRWIPDYESCERNVKRVLNWLLFD